MANKALKIRRQAALTAARKRFDFKRERELNEVLEYAAGSLAEAYKLGAEEARNVILMRLCELPTYSG